MTDYTLLNDCSTEDYGDFVKEASYKLCYLANMHMSELDLDDESSDISDQEMEQIQNRAEQVNNLVRATFQEISDHFEKPLDDVEEDMMKAMSEVDMEEIFEIIYMRNHDLLH